VAECDKSQGVWGTGPPDVSLPLRSRGAESVARGGSRTWDVPSVLEPFGYAQGRLFGRDGAQNLIMPFFRSSSAFSSTSIISGVNRHPMSPPSLAFLRQGLVGFRR